MVASVASLTALTAFLASRSDPPGNDLVFHADLVRGALEALAAGRISVFQDPWFDDLAAGYPVFRVYPHLAHQATAMLAWITGLDAWRAVSLGSAIAALAQPLAVYGGGRILGLGRRASLIAAFAYATMASAAPYGHTPADYWTGSGGLYAQLWGSSLAALAVACVLAACRRDGAGLSALPPWARWALAAAVMSLVLRCHLPSSWVALFLGCAGVVLWGPFSGLPGRLARLGVVYSGAVVLSLGFLVPFITDLEAVSHTSLEDPELIRSVGAVAALGGLVRGEYFDGGVPGPWTAAFALGTVLAVWERFRVGRGGGGARSPLPLLAALCWISVLLYFGRATWGEWIEKVPLVSRFHDQRYLLGLHFVAPWLVAATMETVWRRGRGSRRWMWLAALGMLLLCSAAVLQARRVARDLDEYQAVLPAYRERAQEMSRLLETTAAPGERLALAVADPFVAGTTVRLWQRSRGAVLQGRPGQAYALYSDFGLFWGAWIHGQDGMRARPVTSADLVPAGVTGLLMPERYARLDAAGQPWQLALEPARTAGWWVARPQASPGSRDGMALVRSDLLVRGRSSSLDGFQIAWFAMDLHRAGQYPTIDVTATVDPARYQRVAEIERPDARVLDGLPALGDEPLGAITEVTRANDRPRWSASIDVTSPDAWLLLARSWHPGWRVELDGEPVEFVMLTPGVVAVAVPVGRHEVVFEWPARKGRGVWAVANTLSYVAGAAWLLGWTIRRWRISR